ncbi:LuxR family quorum-sensing system transcriptional regulator CciR [Sphingobium vermicomposti]|uniref:LuxR family quorum-sensing system transcriptional regulator CciR n=2 Tax=Sphingobium vermicomposti TaxID=529005 RepID=A0A846M5G2_9SPHN|nr:LuxR family quorum-sensing system transcriptional regulator CciR [Sphingobium vermicomposti]
MWNLRVGATAFGAERSWYCARFATVISTWTRSSDLAWAVMIGLGQVQEFCAVAATIRDSRALAGLMAEITREMGFRYYALVHHIDLKPAVSSVHIVDYPPDWVECFQARRLYASDPIHRASHRTNVGFAWSAVQSLITLSAADRSILAEAHDAGLGDGFTVPAHIPGEVNGSCSFAMGSGDVLDQRQLPLVQLIGSFAFEAARRLSRQTQARCEGPSLTERQAECVALVARGKTDWEISQILGIGQETVIQHVKDARDRYGVTKRTLLAIRALFDGQISFADVFGR